MALNFKRESFAETIDEAKPLLRLHWDEIARNKNIIPLDPDYAKYALLERTGKLRIFTIRQEGKLVGYACYLVDFHLHYRKTKWAISDIFWTHPEIRQGSSILSLLRFVEKELFKEGPLVMHTTYKDSHPGAGLVLKHLGHTLIEHGYSKVLGWESQQE